MPPVVRMGLRRARDRLLGRPPRGLARPLEDDNYVEKKKETLAKHNLQLWAISNHLVGQAVCDDPIDERHKDILPATIWGDGDPEGVRQRAAEDIKITARAAAKLGVDTVVGFTGSSIWKYRRDVPAGVRQHWSTPATRTSPTVGIPSSTSSTRWACGSPMRCTRARSPMTTGRRSATLEAIGHRPGFGLNWDPSHFVWQDLDPVSFILDFKDRIYHVDCKDAKRRVGNGRNGRLSSHLAWGDLRRGWDFISTGRGDVPWEDCFRALNAIGYDGPISIEWEDAGMDRLMGAPESLKIVRALCEIEPSRGLLRRGVQLGQLNDCRSAKPPTLPARCRRLRRLLARFVKPARGYRRSELCFAWCGEQRLVRPRTSTHRRRSSKSCPARTFVARETHPRVAARNALQGRESAMGTIPACRAPAATAKSPVRAHLTSRPRRRGRWDGPAVTGLRTANGPGRHQDRLGDAGRRAVALSGRFRRPRSDLTCSRRASKGVRAGFGRC